jgi:hypothetical protein
MSRMGREPPHDRRPRRGRAGHHDNVARKLRLRCRFETLILQRAIGESPTNPRRFCAPKRFMATNIFIFCNVRVFSVRSNYTSFQVREITSRYRI